MKAITFNLLAWVMLPIMDGFAKYLSADLPVLQITWARYFFTVVFTFPVMFFFFRKNLVWTDKPKLQFIRGLILLTANICFFYAISVISLAKALTLAFVAPLIVTAFSPVFLGEKVGFRRWSAVIIGGLQALPRGQYDAAKSLGMGYWKLHLLVILPQALKLVIPGIANTFLALVKDTPLIFVVGLLELVGMLNLAKTNPKWLGFSMEGYVFAGIIFWIICYSMSKYSQKLELK